MTPAIPVVIDTDIGADPDDALALILALASPEIDVRGVTIVSGDVAWRGRMAARLLGMAGRPDVPIFLGEGASLDPTHQASMLGTEAQGLLDLPYDGPEATIQPTPATDWLLAESRRAPFHLVAIGPLTNVAVALDRDPGFRHRLLGLTAMGGLLDPQTMPEAWQRDIAQRGAAAWPDYNTTSDPTAALTTARLGSPMTWVPLDVTMRAPLRQKSRDMLPDDRPLGFALGRMIDHWHAYWFPTALPSPYDRSPVPADAVAILHDPLAVAALFAGDWLRPRETRLAYGIEDDIFRMHEDVTGTLATIADRIDGAAFEAFCMARILRQISQ
jgi:purine nucleosidase